MANSLTGDFDVVVEFAIPAANRVLAAMHRIERFPHSIAVRVDDTPPRRPVVVVPSVVELVDAFGDTTVDHRQIVLAATASASPGTAPLGIDAVVNTDVVGATIGPIVPSHLQGRAQVQLSPPTVEVADGTAARIRARIQLMARYFPDANTSPIAEFVRGELQITAAVNQIASQIANVIEIDVKANAVDVVFTPAWSSKPLSAEDVAAIDLLIHNALKTSVLPSNTTLPSNIRSAAVTALGGARPALALLLKMQPGSANASGVQHVFLNGTDDFSVGVGADFVHAVLQPTIDEILATPIPSFSISINVLLTTLHISYSITLNSASVALQIGAIALTFSGHAHTSNSVLPDFDFTVTQLFTLSVDGPTANLVPGPISLDTSSWILNLFRSAATPTMTTFRDRALAQSNAYAKVRDLLNAESTLGPLLQSLLTPIRGKVIPVPLHAALAYSSAEIAAAGIILHGSVSLPAWPSPHVEFERIPTDGGDRPTAVETLPSTPDYSALKTWIPGGVVQQYEWRALGQTQGGIVDDNRFVLLQPPVTATTGTAGGNAASRSIGPKGFSPLCLTVRGSRLSAAGSVVAQPVSGSVCGYSVFPIVTGAVAVEASLPLIALTQPGPRGLDVVGQIAAPVDVTSTGTPNLVVVFLRHARADQLQRLSRVLAESVRADAAIAVLAVLAVLADGQLATAPYVEGVIYSDDEAAWERLFGVESGDQQETLIVSPSGKVVWQHTGELDDRTLAMAFRTVLTPKGPIQPSLLSADARIGHPPPNFLFEFAPDHELTLRKVAGRPTAIVFWRSTSRPSVDAIRDLEASDPKSDGALLVLAVNDGESRAVVDRVVAEQKLTATIVTDARRSISRAYGVKVWPTIVLVDATGLVSGIRYGRAAGAIGVNDDA